MSNILRRGGRLPLWARLGSVSTKCGLSAESASASRVLLMAVFSL
jgi:hypothetical protein